MTELTTSDCEASRIDEYNRVQQLFFDSVDYDQAKNLEVEKIVALHNPFLEQQFIRCYEDVKRRSLEISEFGVCVCVMDCTLKSTDDPNHHQ
jgi:hypothetical protein